MPSLETHQRIVTDLIRGQAEPDQLTIFMAPDAAPGPRAMVYRNSSLLAASDALRSNYRATAAIVGDDFFAGMARAYTQAHRATGRSLVGFGEHLPAFIAAAEAQHGMPWLADFARLDWAWLQSHLAADAEPLAADEFAQIAQDEAALMTAQFESTPCVQRVNTAWLVFDLWADVRADRLPDKAVNTQQGVDHALFWREDWNVTFRRLSPAEAKFVDATVTGDPLGQAAEIALGVDADFDIGQALATAIRNGLFCSQQSNEG